MTKGIDFRFDFSLVHEGNLQNGEGLTPPRMERAIGSAQRAAKKLASRHAAAEIGSPRPALPQKGCPAPRPFGRPVVQANPRPPLTACLGPRLLTTGRQRGLGGG